MLHATPTRALALCALLGCACSSSQNADRKSGPDALRAASEDGPVSADAARISSGDAPTATSQDATGTDVTGTDTRAASAADAATTTKGKVIIVAGSGQLGFSGDGGPATAAKMNGPFSVDFDRAGNMYVPEMYGERVRKIDRAGIITTVAGTGVKGFSGDGGPATQAQVGGVHHLLVGATDDLLLADTWNNRVRRVRAGTIDTLAGTGVKGYSGDGGPATQAQFGGTYCLAFDAKRERLYVADLDNRRIRMVTLATGVVTTVAGNGAKGVPQDGATAVSQPLFDPRAVAVDSKGNVYVLERSGHALRVVDPAGKIRTVAGTGKKGFSGDGGPALQATLNGPKHLTVDAKDEVYIVDAENHVIRKYAPATSLITRVMGSGKLGAAGVGGPAEAVEMNRPHGVAFDASGAMYVADSDNHRVLKVDL